MGGMEERGEQGWPQPVAGGRQQMAKMVGNGRKWQRMAGSGVAGPRGEEIGTLIDADPRNGNIALLMKEMRSVTCTPSAKTRGKSRPAS
jgi:hypothetical protein